MQARARLEQQRAALTAEHAALRERAARVTDPRLKELDQELAAMRRSLAELPRPGLKSGSPSNGYHSAIAARPDETKWVQVDLGRSLPLDEIVLEPARPTDFADTPGFGFPVRFRVEVAGDPGFARPETVADRTARDYPNPGDQPWILRLDGRKARCVRVTATRLWQRTGDYLFALAELQVLSSGRNAAAGAAVTALDSIEAGRWSRRFLVDNFDSRSSLPDPAERTAAAYREQERELQERLEAAEQRRAELADRLLDPAISAGLERTAAALAECERQLRALPAPSLVYAVLPHAPRSIHVLARGDVEQPREAVSPGALSCLPGLQAEFALPHPDDEGSRRAALARWLTSRRNVLTWRSIVNRVWHYHFGRGLVETVNDFGRNGARPSHPELLDWLAAAFVAKDEGGRMKDEFRTSKSGPDSSFILPPSSFRGGLSLKRLHRLIMLSATYRQSSAENLTAARVDGENRLLGRMNRRRLEAEAVRDSILAVSGRLDLAMGGPGFELFRFKDDHSPVYEHGDPEKITSAAGWRRSVYRFTVRSVPNPFLECLDCADPNISTPIRSTTVTALQALALLNDPFVLQQAECFAERLQRAGPDPPRQVALACQLAFGRPPRPEESAALQDYAKRNGLPKMCRLVFNTNEFVFVD
jgi:Protein of unknown function (DUF1553)